MNNEEMNHLTFIVLNGILDGRCDRFLLRLRAAINARMATDEYKAHIIVGGAS